MTDDARQCWQCGCEEFNLVGVNDVRAVCTDCDTEHVPMNTYVPEETPREDYDVSP